MFPLVDAASVRDWLVSVTIVFGGVGGIMTVGFRYVVAPNFERILESAVTHELRGMNRRLEKVEHELVPNGDEYRMPAELRDQPMRNIMGKHITTSEADRYGIHETLEAHNRRIQTLENIHLRDIAGGAEGVSST